MAAKDETNGENSPKSSNLPSVATADTYKPQKKRGYCMSKATMEEFNIQQHELPTSMREDSDEELQMVDQNKQVAKHFNEINKVLYLAKMKHNTVR